MAGRRRAKREITSYRHRGEERVNNPPVGLVTPATDPDGAKRTYEFDPHLDPQLVWAGKAEHTSFEVPTVSLHVHERIDPRSIIESVRRNGEDVRQPSLFEAPEENLPMRQAVQFYQHRKGWTNRLLAGDSLLVMNSLLEKEGLGGQVQMIYIDPPYGIRYGSNFQPFVNKRSVIDGRDRDLSSEPETIRAYRDTWELGIHSYLSYLRDRLLLARDLLTDSGSVLVQISDENLHLVRMLMDEVYGSDNFVALIPFRKKTMPLGTKLIEQMDDFLLWFSKDKAAVKYRPLFHQLTGEGDWHYQWCELEDGSVVRLSKSQVNNHALLPQNSRLFRLKSLEPSGPMAAGVFDYEFSGTNYPHPRNGYCTTRRGLENLDAAGRLGVDGRRLAYKQYVEDWGVSSVTAPWQDTIGPRDKVFVVQTSHEVVKRCILMATDPGDLVFDPTCGSGTTAFVAEQWGRRWITCDTSRVALSLAKQRLVTALYDYYELAYPEEDVGSGFRYKTVPHITLGAIANNPDIGEAMSQATIDAAVARHAPQETLYDQPLIERSKARVTGPFTVEAVPAPVVQPLNGAADIGEPDSSFPSTNGFDVATPRSGETLRQSDWRDELLETGIRGQGGQRISFGRLEPQAGTRWLHAVGETQPHFDNVDGTDGAPIADTPQTVAVSFGPNHAPLEQRQVEKAWQEALTLNPRPDLLVFAAFQFDPEAAKDIDEMDPALSGPAVSQGADERGPADRRPQAQAVQQREFLADRPA